MCSALLKSQGHNKEIASPAAYCDAAVMTILKLGLTVGRLGVCCEHKQAGSLVQNENEVSGALGASRNAQHLTGLQRVMHTAFGQLTWHDA